MVATSCPSTGRLGTCVYAHHLLPQVTVHQWVFGSIAAYESACTGRGGTWTPAS